MSKDFYSDDHTVQAGAPGSGAGNLSLEGEVSVSVIGKRSESSRGVVEVTEVVLLKGGEATDGSGSFGLVKIQGSDCIAGIGSLVTVGSNYVPIINENCDLKVFGNISGYTENGNPEMYTENGTIKFRAVNGEVKVITPETTIDGNLTVTGTITGSSTQTDGLSNAGDINITTTNGGDINLSATGISIPLSTADINISATDINITATDDVIISSGSDLTITAEDDIVIRSGTNSTSGNITLTAGDDPTSPYITIREDTNRVSVIAGELSVTADTSTFFGDLEVTNEKSSGYITTLTNSSSDSGADILQLEFADITDPASTNNWIQFSANGSSKGSVQGADAATGYYVVYVPTKVYPLDFAIRDDKDPLTTSSGYVQYTSGNQDFGEWIPLGDESEWGITEESKKELLKSSFFPVQEGITLYIRDSKVWKTGPGRGMIVTHRAIVIGNQNYKEDGRLGIIMSFIGQVPTFVEGQVEDGDLLVPVEGTNHTRAINPETIQFSDYRKAVGTAWGKKLTTEVGLVNCAIGIK